MRCLLLDTLMLLWWLAIGGACKALGFVMVALDPASRCACAG